MKEFFRTIGRDAVLVWGFRLSVGIFFLTLIGAILTFTSLPPYIPLYNHMPWGYARVGHAYELFIPIGIVLLMIIINSIIGAKLLLKAPLLVRFLFITMTILAIFTCIFIGRLILVTL